MARTQGSRGKRRGIVERTFDELISSLNALRHVLDKPARSSPAKGAAKRGSRHKSVRVAASSKRTPARRRRSRKSAAA